MLYLEIIVSDFVTNSLYGKCVLMVYALVLDGEGSGFDDSTPLRTRCPRKLSVVVTDFCHK